MIAYVANVEPDPFCTPANTEIGKPPFDYPVGTASGGVVQCGGWYACTTDTLPTLPGSGLILVATPLFARNTAPTLDAIKTLAGLPGPSLLPVAFPSDVIDAVGGGFVKDTVAGDIKAAGADPESPLDQSVLNVLDYLSGSRDPAGGYRNPGDGAGDALGTKLNPGAMGVGPAAKRTQSLRAAADSDTTAGATYDSNGNLTRLDYDDDTSEQWTYDAATGQVASYTDQEGRLTKQHVDPATGNVVSVTRVVGEDDEVVNADIDPYNDEHDDLTTCYGYTTEDDPDGLPAGLLVSVTDPEGNVALIDYESDPESADFGRAVALTYVMGQRDDDPERDPGDPDDVTIGLGYDAAGDVNSLTDAVANETTWVLDAEGRVVEETIAIDATEYTRFYAYDAEGRLWRYTDRKGRTIEYLYYATGDAEGMIQFERWFAAYADPDTATPVRTITYAYEYEDGVLTEFSVDDTDVDLVYTYDAAGYLTGTSWDFVGLAGADDVTLAYTYLYGDLQTTTATVDGTGDFKNEYAHDAFGRLTQVTQTGVTGGNPVADKRVDFTYNDAGQLETIARYSDLDGLDLVASTLYTYNADVGWLTSLVHEINNAAQDTISYGYTYEDDGQIDTIASSSDAGTYDYDYDNTGQLTAVDYTGTGDGVDESYQYDDNGNRESSTVDGQTQTYTTGAYNRMETVDDGTTVTVIGYDAEGNTLLKFTDVDESGSLTTGDTQITEYAWDHRNRLVCVTDYATFAAYHVTASQVVQYGYDLLNRLVVRTLDGETEYFIYDGDSLATDWILAEFGASDDADTPLGPDPAFDLGQIVLQLDEDGCPTHRYLWGQAVDQILADEAVDDGSLEDVLWLLTDHQNTVRDMVRYDNVEEEWAVANHIVYGAFGSFVSETNAAIDCLFAWTARPFDTATGLQQNGNRWYSVLTACWWSEDPIGINAGDANLYRYCGSDPVGRVDPSGLLPRGHHKVPENLWAWMANFISPDIAKEIFDAEDARVFPPENEDGSSMGHNRTAHGPTTGYDAEIRALADKEFADFRRQNKIRGRLTPAQQREFCKRLLNKIDSMGPDTFIGGFNRAVVRGGTKAVTEWRDQLAKKAMRQAREGASGIMDMKKTKLASKLAAVGIIGLVANSAAIAQNIIGEPENVARAKREFLDQYRVAMSEANRRKRVSGKTQVNLFNAFRDYLQSLGLDTTNLEWAWGHIPHPE